LVIVSLLGKAQSHEEGSIVINLGVGIGIYNGTYNAPGNENDNTGTFPLVNIPIKIEYGIKSNLSVGLLFQPLSLNYTGENDDKEIRTIKISGLSIAPSINYHFNPEGKTDYYIGFAPGYTSFTWNSTEPATSKIEEGKFGGFGMKFDLGARFYIANKVSLNLNLAYGMYSTKLKSYVENKVTTDNPEGKLNFNGFEPSIGLGFKI
jgi:outer membrane protein W